MEYSSLPIIEQDGVTILTLEKCLTNNFAAEELGTEVVQLMDECTEPKLIVDFSNVDFISSATLGAMLMIKTSIDANQGNLKLACFERKVHELFELTMLSQRFSIHLTIDDALADF